MCWSLMKRNSPAVEDAGRKARGDSLRAFPASRSHLSETTYIFGADAGGIRLCRLRNTTGFAGEGYSISSAGQAVLPLGVEGPPSRHRCEGSAWAEGLPSSYLSAEYITTVKSIVEPQLLLIDEKADISSPCRALEREKIHTVFRPLPVGTKQRRCTREAAAHGRRRNGVLR